MTVVLAYSGSARASAALAALVDQGAEVVTLTLDIGQSEPLEGIRARALASGAVRAHVVDAREAFVRTCVLPAMQAAAPVDVETLAQPLIATMLDEVALIEGADPLPLEHAAPRASEAAPRDRNLLTRPSVDPSRTPEAEARLDITLEDGIPTAINDVPMTLVELIESLSLIAGHYGVGHMDSVQAPAAVMLRAIYASAGGASATVRLTLHKGTYTVQPSAESAAVATHS